MKEDLENTRALNELTEQIKKIDVPVNDMEDELETDTKEFETREEVFNDLVSNENTNEITEEKKEEVNEEKDDNKKKKKDKKSLKEKWNNLSKKNKIIILVSIGVIFLIIIGVILYIVLSPKQKQEEEKKEDVVIVVKDNYRYENGKLVFLSNNDNDLGEYECNNKDENLCYVAYLNNDEDPFEVAKNTYENGDIIKKRARIYLDRYAFIIDTNNNKDTTITLYDFKDKKEVEKYQSIKSYDDSSNQVILTNDRGDYGLFELKENEVTKVIDFSYSFMGINKKDTKYLVVKNNKGSFIIDYNNKARTKAIPGTIVDYNEKYIIAKDSNKYNLYDLEAEKYITDYDYMRFVSEDILALVKDKMLYFKNADNRKYNEEGYALNNEEYITVNIYDNDNKLKETKNAFGIELHDKQLNLTIDKDTFKIDLNEGEVSALYDYYSYFDGKLYFYSDVEKNELINKYECNNKNEIQKNEFMNCYIAKDTNLSDTYVNPKKEENVTIPIYNSNYVFVYDSPTLVNDSNYEIKFYDLKNKKVLGTYQTIDTDVKDNGGKFSHINVDTTSIIAKLKTGKYGVINITSNGVNVAHKFEYDYIERYGTNFLAKKDNGSWVILYENDSTSYEFDGKIMNNNNSYMIISKNDNVKIYPNKNNANALNDKEFKYIELTSKVYGAVDSSNKLWLYLYDNLTPINTDGIGLTTNTYYNTSTPSFKIEISGNNVYVKVYNGNSYVDFGPYSTIVEENNHETEE